MRRLFAILAQGALPLSWHKVRSPSRDARHPRRSVQRAEEAGPAARPLAIPLARPRPGIFARPRLRNRCQSPTAARHGWARSAREPQRAKGHHSPGWGPGRHTVWPRRRVRSGEAICARLRLRSRSAILGRGRPIFLCWPRRRARSGGRPQPATREQQAGGSDSNGRTQRDGRPMAPAGHRGQARVRAARSLVPLTRPRPCAAAGGREMTMPP